MGLIEEMFPKKLTSSDKMACCKRAWIVVFGDAQLYMRPPSHSKDTIAKVVPYPEGVKREDLIVSKEGKGKLRTYKSLADKTAPAEMADDLEWSEAVLRLRLLHENPKGFLTIGRTVDSDTGVVIAEGGEMKPLTVTVQSHLQTVQLDDDVPLPAPKPVSYTHLRAHETEADL
eukprot:1012912-Amphidinium_carterae.1